MAVPTGVLVLSVSLAFASALGSSMGPTLHSQLAVASPRLAHWEAAGVAFDYPAAWRILARDITARHYESIPAVVGTGTWSLNCHALPVGNGSFGGEECGPDTIDVPAAGVVVVMSSEGGPPIVPGALARPSSAIALVDGAWAEASESGLASDWTISFPVGDAPLHVTARYAPPGVEASRSAVRALVLSLRLAKR